GTDLEPEARQLDIKERDGAVVGDPADLVGQVIGVQGRADVDAVLDEPHVAVASQGNGGGNVVGIGQREVAIHTFRRIGADGVVIGVPEYAGRIDGDGKRPARVLLAWHVARGRRRVGGRP